MCFAWDHKDPKRGLLRSFVSNNWNITPQMIRSDFYTQKQQLLPDTELIEYVCTENERDIAHLK